MKLTERTKFWMVFSCIIIAALIGGILGNWAFIYLLDKYYGVPGGNYYATSSSVTPVIVNDSKKVIIEQDNQITQSISSADAEFVRIFKRQSDTTIYQKKDALNTAVVVTSDGWLVTNINLTSDKNALKNFIAITPDRRRFSIENVITDSLSGLSYIHLLQAQNLPVRNLLSKKDLSIGQTLIALNNDGTIELGRLSRSADVVFPSEGYIETLQVSNLSNQEGFIFDAAGQMVGIEKAKSILAMDSVQRSLEKVLTDGKIVRPRFGVHYLNLANALAQGKDSGALVVAMGKEAAVVPGSPADKAGIKSGDIIVSLDDTAISEFNDLAGLVAEYRPGDTVNVVLRRGQETKKVIVTIDTLPSN